MTHARTLIALAALLAFTAAPARAAAPETVTIPSQSPDVADEVPIAVPVPPPSAPAAAPVAPAAPSKNAAAKNPDEPIDTSTGTTIVGDQEAPVGLYIAPWKDEFAERGLDRPARLVDEALVPIDPATFRRQLEYYDSISKYRRAKQQPAGGAANNNP